MVKLSLLPVNPWLLIIERRYFAAMVAVWIVAD